MAKHTTGTGSMNLNRINNLLDQMVEKAKIDDDNQKKLDIAGGKAQRTAGESWMVFHLKNLKELIKIENEK